MSNDQLPSINLFSRFLCTFFWQLFTIDDVKFLPIKIGFFKFLLTAFISSFCHSSFYYSSFYYSSFYHSSFYHSSFYHSSFYHSSSIIQASIIKPTWTLWPNRSLCCSCSTENKKNNVSFVDQQKKMLIALVTRRLDYVINIGSFTGNENLPNSIIRRFAKL